MPQRHNVVIPLEDGGVEVHPLKEWLRQHPDALPGMDPNSSTSHQLRGALRHLGWTMQESPTEIRLIKPGSELNVQNIGEVLGSNEVTDDDERRQAFALEYQLRDFLASNIGSISINGKHLRLFVNSIGRDGIEFPSGVGPIDILALDDNGAFVVFELKRANSPDKAIGQLFRYMGWVQQTIGRGREVFGVIVAQSISENLRYAASIVPKVYLYEYEVEFHLRPAHDLR